MGVSIGRIRRPQCVQMQRLGKCQPFVWKETDVVTLKMTYELKIKLNDIQELNQKVQARDPYKSLIKTELNCSMIELISRRTLSFAHTLFSNTFY